MTTATKASGRKPGASPPRARPMARVTRIALFEREVRERLSRSALELVLRRAEVMSEGQRERRSGPDVFLGSTMLTMDLPALADLVRDACDAGTARRLASLLETDAALPPRIQRIAHAEVERLTGTPPRRVETEIAIRAQGARVFVDVDVEATF